MKRLLLPLLAAIALPAAVEAGYSSEIDLMTDETKIRVFHQSETKVPNAIGIEESATIYIRCNLKDKEISDFDVYIDTPSYNANNHDVGLRWDKGEPIYINWNKSKDGTALFSPTPKKFISTLMDKDTLVFQWTPYNKIPQAVKFNLSELKKDIDNIKKEGCFDWLLIESEKNSTLGFSLNNSKLNFIDSENIERKDSLVFTCLNCVKPKYPRRAFNTKQEGEMRLKLYVQKNGEVNKVEVIKSSGFKLLDKAGIKAAMASTFYPIEYPGEIEIEYNMKIN